MSWLLDFIPTWAWTLAGAAVLVAAWRLLGTRGFLAVLAAVVTLGAYRAGRTARGQEEKAKRAREVIAAKEERLEMHREATEAEREAARMTDDEARKEAMKWAKPR